MQEQTACPFARRAKLWGAPPHRDDQTFAGNVQNALPHLHSFTKAAHAEVLDGFLFCFPAECYGRGPDAVARTVAQLLSTLAAHDPVHPRALHRADITQRSWRFTLAGEEYFVNVITQHYGADHPRHSHRSHDTSFVLLQPGTSFHTGLS